MNESFESGPLPLHEPEITAETLLREYLDQLLGALDLDRVRDSCARERALACVIHGVVGPLADHYRGSLSERDLAEVAFGELEDRLGWFDENASVLEVYAGVETTGEGEAHADFRDRYLNDPYRRHALYWHQCEEAGYADFQEWWETREGDHDRALAAIDGAALAVGDE